MSESAAQNVLYGSLIAGAIGMWLAASQRAAALRLLGSIVASAGLIAAVTTFGNPVGDITDKILFWMFAVSALLSAVMMVTCRSPVYAALWFALATLGTCGLFMMQAAPFLAAATIIVYAGAIVVTFLFVMMLAQQSGATIYDQRSQQPLAATVVFVGEIVTLQGRAACAIKNVRPSTVIVALRATVFGFAATE